jgi:hypothetical protein
MKLSCGGIWFFFKTMAALIMPAIPLTASVWPRLAFALP